MRCSGPGGIAAAGMTIGTGWAYTPWGI